MRAWYCSEYLLTLCAVLYPPRLIGCERQEAAACMTTRRTVNKAMASVCCTLGNGHFQLCDVRLSSLRGSAACPLPRFRMYRLRLAPTTRLSIHRRHADHPSLVGGRHTCATPQKAHRSTSHMASRKPGLGLDISLLLLGKAVTIHRTDQTLFLYVSLFYFRLGLSSFILGSFLSFIDLGARRTSFTLVDYAPAVAHLDMIQ